MTTRVVNINKEPHDFYIGRPSEWGNPFSHRSGTLAKFKVDSREEAVECYRKWIMTQPELLKKLHTLKSKTLGCFCKPLACHGDILVELINELK